MNQSKHFHRSRIFLAALLGIPCAGCNPNMDIDGALLPGWLMVAVLGVLCTMAVRTLLLRIDLDRFLVVKPLVYLSLTVTFGCGIWLVVFRT